MARPRTPIGMFCDIEFTALANGVVRARVRVRDLDGRLRRVEARGPTRKAAEHRLAHAVLSVPRQPPLMGVGDDHDLPSTT